MARHLGSGGGLFRVRRLGVWKCIRWRMRTVWPGVGANIGPTLGRLCTHRMVNHIGAYGARGVLPSRLRMTGYRHARKPGSPLRQRME